jgi:hypothetical protein
LLGNELGKAARAEEKADEIVTAGTTLGVKVLLGHLSLETSPTERVNAAALQMVPRGSSILTRLEPCKADRLATGRNVRRHARVGQSRASRRRGS